MTQASEGLGWAEAQARLCAPGRRGPQRTQWVTLQEEPGLEVGSHWAFGWRALFRAPPPSCPRQPQADAPPSSAGG